MKNGKISVALLNLMPMKEEAEADIRRQLSETSAPVELLLMKMRSHVSKHASAACMARYRFFDEMCNEPIDGLIVNGAPVELLPFEEVDYWDELCEVFKWARARELPALYICWGAQAALHALYGIEKFKLERKMFGIFRQRIIAHGHTVFKGFEREFMMPHSRHTEIRREDIVACSGLQLLAEGEECGVSVVAGNGGREIFVTGHLEYAADRLDWEYRRDSERRSDVGMPVNYYRNDNPALGPLYTWEKDSSRFFVNWVNTLIMHNS